MRVRNIAVFVTMLAITISASAYAASFGANEIVHFWIAFPAGVVSEPKVIRIEGGPTIVLKPIIIDISERGFLKKLINGHVEALSTHWIYNVGNEPIRIRLEMINGTIPIRWIVKSDNPFDYEAKTFLKPIEPMQKIRYLSIDWVFYFPKDYENRRVLYEGGLAIYNANTNELLTLIPIKIVNRASRVVGGLGCCS